MTGPLDQDTFQKLYSDFAPPLAQIDCGSKCGPHNACGVPFCCDIEQVIPSAFEQEWAYLRENTDLWQPWSSSGDLAQELDDQLQDGQVLLMCKGHRECQRDFRTVTCRAFPFYPYLDQSGELRGLAYYPEFRQVCWIISNLDLVSQAFKEAFQKAFLAIFAIYPEYHQNFLGYCHYVRTGARERNEQILLLDFSGDVYVIDPQAERINQVEYKDLPAFGPYQITRELQFPDERLPDQDT